MFAGIAQGAGTRQPRDARADNHAVAIVHDPTSLQGCGSIVRRIAGRV
jgi:hypothetical protein